MVLSNALKSLAIIAVVGATSLTAQDRSVFFFAHGGSQSALKNLNPGGTADFDTGFNVGGGVGVAINRYVSVRGDLTFARSDANAPGTGFDGADFNRYFYGGDVVLQLPLANNRIAPYIFGGGGGVTIDPRVATGATSLDTDSFTKGAGRFGTGVKLNVAGTRLGLYGEAMGVAYKFDRLGFDRTQVDLLVKLGLSYAAPLP